MSPTTNKIVRTIGITVLFAGMIAIGVSIFAPIKCLGTGILVVAIGTCMIWSTEGAFIK